MTEPKPVVLPLHHDPIAMQKYELFLKHARLWVKNMREKCDFLLFLPENRLLGLILVVNARCFAMSAKTKWRRSSLDFYCSVVLIKRNPMRYLTRRLRHPKENQCLKCTISNTGIQVGTLEGGGALKEKGALKVRRFSTRRLRRQLCEPNGANR